MPHRNPIWPIRHAWLGSLVLALLAGLAPGVAFAADPPSLRVMTYNIHHGEGTDGRFDLERLAKIIRTADPDLVALQEVDRRTRRAGGVDQAAELARLTGLELAFGRSIELEGGEYGNAILARVEPTEVQVHPLPSPEPGEPRTALAAKCTFPDGRTSIFVVTHLCHLSAKNRAAQTAKLTELFGPSKLPVILAGDLNALPDSAPVARLEGWTNPLEDARTIDYVLFRTQDRWRSRSARKLAEPVASDHDPVVVELAWPEQP
ncbi:MAG: endonuclease/exonuclease/phosphatase family protein [Pirellulales bacterium]